MDGWKTTFLLGRPIFRGNVSFREGRLPCCQISQCAWWPLKTHLGTNYPTKKNMIQTCSKKKTRSANKNTKHGWSQFFFWQAQESAYIKKTRRISTKTVVPKISPSPGICRSAPPLPRPNIPIILWMRLPKANEGHLLQTFGVRRCG